MCCIHKYDFLLVGAGLFNVLFHEAMKSGRKCLVVKNSILETAHWRRCHWKANSKCKSILSLIVKNMKKIALSKSKFNIYLIIIIIQLLFSLFITICLTICIWKNSHYQGIFFFLTIMFVFQWIIYPIVLFIVLYKKDKDTLFIIDETTGDIQYRNKEEIINFNKNDVYEIQYCILFMRTTFSDYSKLRLLSGKEIVVSFFVPVNKILSKNKIKRTSKYVFWINEIFKS